MPPRKAKTLPDEAIVGWGAARTILERCDIQARRELLAGLARGAGVQGAPGLDYLARLLRWHADEAPSPIPRKELTGAECRFIERRAVELLEPYAEVEDQRLARKLFGLNRDRKRAA
jgi:hypothetical protein